MTLFQINRILNEKHNVSIIILYVTKMVMIICIDFYSIITILCNIQFFVINSP